MATGRRARGVLLRLVMNRPLVLAIGAVCVIPAGWVLLQDYAWESGATDGLALLLLATGVALVWTGIAGRQPDWIDPDPS